MTKRSGSSYITYFREEWSYLYDSTFYALTEKESAKLLEMNHKISFDEIKTIYLPLSQLLHLHITGYQNKQQTAAASSLSSRPLTPPFIVGITGSVAVGKSTTATVLESLLKGRSEDSDVVIVSTDNFLYPNHILEQRGILQEKGFPETYDREHLIRFLQQIKSGHSDLEIPIYSHLIYDILPGKTQRIGKPNILILEGLNVLQESPVGKHLISDFIDFSIYIDADKIHIFKWYMDRFRMLFQTAHQDPDAYLYSYTHLPLEEVLKQAEEVWRKTNQVNLKRYIDPTRLCADLILEKGVDHKVERVRLRRGIVRQEK